jgi:hypothetical protein
MHVMQSSFAPFSPLFTMWKKLKKKYNAAKREKKRFHGT